MKESAPGPRAQLRFERLLLRFVLLLVLAIFVWMVQDFVASLASREMMARTDLWTPAQWDDARVLRAFQKAKRTVRFAAKLETNANGFHPERHDYLTVVAPTKREAIEGRKEMVEAMRAAFAEDGPDWLNSSREAPRADWAPNGTTTMLRNGCRALSLVLAAFALASLFLKWRRSHLPFAALLGILATAFSMLTTTSHSRRYSHRGTVVDELWAVLFVVGVPASFLGLMIYVTRRVRKAANWQEGHARITRSEVKSEVYRFVGEASRVRNIAAVEYEFTVGSKIHHGSRISIGLAPADRVDETLRRYPVGAGAPVFYDSEKPADCVLEREPPVSLGCLWGGALAVLLAYVVVIAWLWSGWSLGVFLSKAAPPSLHHPLVAIGAGAFGLFCLAAGVWNRLHPKTLAPWIRTPGAIVSSKGESYGSGSASSGTRAYYNALIEFSYKVGGQEYHGLKGASDLLRIAGASGKEAAEAEAARYPSGMAVDVYYDPENPPNASLEPNPGTTLTGNSALVVGAVLLAVALYAATH